MFHLQMIYFQLPMDVTSEKRFYVVEQFSIKSHRLTGKDVQSKLASGNVQDALKKASRTGSSSLDSSDGPATPVECEDGEELKLPLRFGAGGLGDKFATQWDWPYPNKPVVQNTFNNLEVIIDFTPFASDEIWAQVMGTDLIIRLHGKSGNCVRTYKLPLNTDPRTIRFKLDEQNSKLKISAVKVPVIKLAIASYVDNLQGLIKSQKISETDLEEMIKEEIQEEIRELHIHP